MATKNIFDYDFKKAAGQEPEPEKYMGNVTAAAGKAKSDVKNIFGAGAPAQDDAPPIGSKQKPAAKQEEKKAPEEAKTAEVVKTDAVAEALMRSLDAEKQMPRLYKGSRVVRMTFGDDVQRFPIPRMKYMEDRRYLVAVLSEELLGFQRHFFDVDDVGFIHCTGGLCCKVGKPSTPLVGMFVAVIPTDAQGEPVHPIKPSVRLHVTGVDGYEHLQDLRLDHKSLKFKGLTIRCTDQKFQKLNVSVHPTFNLGSEPAMIKVINNYIERHIRTIDPMMGKTMSDRDLAELLGINEADYADENPSGGEGGFIG